MKRTRASIITEYREAIAAYRAVTKSFSLLTIPEERKAAKPLVKEAEKTFHEMEKHYLNEMRTNKYSLNPMKWNKDLMETPYVVHGEMIPLGDDDYAILL